MAGSRFEYVRSYEEHAKCLPNTYIAVRIDGRGFSKFTKANKYHKPNDERGLKLMNAAAQTVLRTFPDIFLAYGQSDEYSFVFSKDTDIFQRRRDKILSSIVSLFSSSFACLWGEYQPFPMKGIPQFDGRIILYPHIDQVKDYFAWRQVDCHINNLYNTTFWALVKSKTMTAQAAKLHLDGTNSSDKNEILYKKFNTNYNNELEMFRKGSVLTNKPVTVVHIDIIKNKEFWASLLPR